jgi:hypothetical protein
MRFNNQFDTKMRMLLYSELSVQSFLIILSFSVFQNEGGDRRDDQYVQFNFTCPRTLIFGGEWRGEKEGE